MTTVNGHHTYRGTTIMQHVNIGVALKKLFQETQPARVLEIGTSSGGLTMLIRDTLNELELYNTHVRSYDVNPDSSRYWLLDDIKNGANIDFQLKNIFNHTYNAVIDDGETESYIQQSGRTIVMCDGGSKKWEFKLLSKYLKVGDIIMAHDYAPNKEYFENILLNNIWNWWEISDEHIDPTCIENNLVPFMQEDFLNVVWVCKIKQK